MRYFVESYGCTMNFGEGEQLSKKMESLGHTRVDSPDEADIVILNTCTVVDTTEKKMIHRMGELKQEGKEIIVTGCMAKVQPKRISIRLPESMIIPPDQYDLFSGKVESAFGCAPCTETYEFGASAILPIAQGCLGNCSYCITRFARGVLKSYQEDELLNEFKSMLDSGVKEILVTAQDTACYGRDIDTDLPTLLRRFLEFEGEYRIRIGMMNPNNLDRILDDLMDVMEDERVYRFLHIPVQSGSNSVLEKMRRHYTVDRFMGIVNRLRERYPDISIATDLITGFPGETERDHEKSIKLIKDLHADTVNITRFSVRPGTDAATMKNQIHGNISKERSTELTETKMSVEGDINSTLIGQRYRALVTENGRPGTMIARNRNYRPIGIEADIPIGTFIDVEITGSAPTHLVGRIANHQ
ncbi:tRNA (N(6)-L-threonylcarbamoyladenosine(37)-C(2))-methylthiotransferase [Candidatus Methanarcanum hacksteinii]|uniref:tRNA (N(6)-L-threonylcarbamoyladenosine(37)-C(2))- methylthiotransferase n=1 Tax=Candidatus Methanarcanum hacksteinii TaxID=2911857 RepID=UPI0037DC9F39|nr:MAG: tRNA N6-threonylcarbamoyladenosine 2- methylthiotransferase / tRNA-i(6)A37 methylthiotransferase [Candidatus Methanarcanum hacksteinii]